ncbi:hypothetical protein NUW54_g14493 [Trametes sanguinea]|uniref:Uncharacterized protein n=1 Tax=Trametes sanguinea TaxID=158606 RepID=A0ACC1MCX5_9APHY|nr:hypothetical protein NUW54_g14493 [Trametes sanguinea]
MVWHVIRSLGLDVSLRIVVLDGAKYATWSDYCAMCDHAVQLKRTQFPADSLNEYLLNEHDATLINLPLRQLSRWSPPRWIRGLRMMEVHWVTFLLFLRNQYGQDDLPEKTSYLAYGNESSIAHAYWKVSLLVRVGPFGKRATGAAGPQPQQG